MRLDVNANDRRRADRRCPAADARALRGPRRPVRGGRRPEVVLVHRTSGSADADWSNSDGRPEPGSAGGPHRRRAGRPGWSPTRMTGRSAGSASGRARTTSAWPGSKILAPVDDTPVWSIVCFVVSRRARGRGLASGAPRRRRRRMRASDGATTLEAYPVDAGDGRIPAANAYHGHAQRCSRRPGSRSSSGASPTPPARPADRPDRAIAAPSSPLMRREHRATSRPGEADASMASARLGTHGPELTPPTSSVASPTSSSDEG